MAAATVVWIGVGLARSERWQVAAVLGLGAVAVAAAVGLPWRSVVALVLLAAASVGSGLASMGREGEVLSASVPDGRIEVAGVTVTDTRPTRFGSWFLLRPETIVVEGRPRRWTGPDVRVGSEVEVSAGSRVEVLGTSRNDPGRAAGRPYAGRIEAKRVEVVGPASRLDAIANRIRARLGAGSAGSPEEALLAGFLIGDVRNLPAADQEAMRRAGLSHFVAVSGSNVALFLGMWWLVTGPLVRGSASRALAGVAGLILFVVVTRGEPSVIRAALMAGVVLAGRAAGVPVGPWAALGAAVAISLLVSGELAGSVGFQLSVAATGGVLVGASIPVGVPRMITRPLAITLGAQLAVGPLLLWHFGSVPLMAPVANVLAAPLVAASTGSGGIGLLTGIAPLADVGVALAGLVLDIAWLASPLPQLDWLGPVAMATALAAVAIRRVRVPAAVAMLVGTGLLLFWPHPELPIPAAVFLDVGQGDAALIVGSSGETILVDGGPDPAILAHKLSGLGIDRIDLLVISHPHLDHVGGLETVVARLPVEMVWHSDYRPAGEQMAEVLAALEERGALIRTPGPGQRMMLGSIALEVIGPVRRYASPNDQSLVFAADVGATTVLFTGDIEQIAQHELGPLSADILKVPHQGASTSDLGWLAAAHPLIAIISVGPNDYGHPAPEVVSALAGAGALVLRTDQQGDVVIPLR